MGKRKSIVISAIAVITILLISGLVLVNRDLFHYSYDTLLERDFIPGSDAKRDYLLFGPLTLKPGVYELSTELQMEGYGSGIFLTDGDDNNFFSADLPIGEEDPSFSFEVSGAARQVRFGVRYDPETSSVRLKRVCISADHVLTRESLLHHVSVSLLMVLLWAVTAARVCCPEKLWKLFPPLARRENEYALFLLVFLTAAVCYPLFNGKTYVHGEDMFFHLTRIRGLAESLKAGYFPVRNQLYWLHNYGYGVGFYYPDALLYFPAAMVLLGFELLTSYKIFLIVCSFFSIASAWYAGWKISGNRTAAAASAIFMAFAAYRLSNVYYRGAVGETQAAMFYPLIILGLYEIFQGNRKRWPVFALGFLGLFCSHIISLTIAALLTALYLLIRIRTIIRQPGIIGALLKAVGLVVCVGAFFWMPMLEQSMTNPALRINNVLEGDVVLNGTNYAFPVENLLSPFKAWNFAFQADCIYPGWSLLLVPLLGIVLWKRRGGAVKTADFLLLFSLPILWMCTRSFPWEWPVFLPFVVRIQFAYRMLLPVSVMMSLSGGIYVSKLATGRSRIPCLCLLGLFCFFSTAFPVLQESVQNRSVDKRLFVMQDNRVSGGEYLPVGMDNVFPDKNADSVLTEDGVQLTVTAHKRQKLGFSFSYEIPDTDQPVYFSVPLIYYTGYQGTLTDEKGNVRKAEIGWDDRGLVRLSNEGITRGSVTVEYKKTGIQLAGEILTTLSIGVLLFIVVKKRRDHKIS